MNAKMFRLAKHYLLKEKRKTITIILILSITLASFILINQSVDNMQKLKIYNAEQENGREHFNYKNSSIEEYNKLKNHYWIDKVGREWVIGSREDGAYELMLLYRDDIYNEIDPSLNHMVDGKRAEKVNEIVLSKNYINLYDLQIGDTVNITFEKFNYITGEKVYDSEKAFTITGIIEGLDYYQELHIGLVSEELKDQLIKKENIDNLSIRFVNEKNIINKIQRIAADLNLQQPLVYNDNLIFAIEDNEIIQSANIVINLLIFFAIGLVIYNVMYFNLISKRKDLGIMRSLGINKRELIKVILYQVYLYIAVSIPIGLLIGQLLNYLLFDVILKLILKKGYTNHIPVEIILGKKIILKSILLTIITMIPSIVPPFIQIGKLSPLDVIRKGSEEIIIKPKGWIYSITKRIKNKLTSYGLKNLLRNKKRTIITVISLVLAFILTSIVLYNNRVGQEEEMNMFREYMPGDLIIKDTYLRENLSIQKPGFSKELLDTLQRYPNIKEVNAYKIKDVFHRPLLENVNVNSNHYRQIKSYLDDITREEDGEVFIYDCLTAIGIEDIKNYIDSSLTNVKDHDVVIISRELADFLNARVGDKIPIVFVAIDETSLITSKENRKIFTIGKILEEIPIIEYGTAGPANTILMNIDSLMDLTETNGYERFDVWLDDKTDLSSIISIKSIDELQGKAEIKTYEETIAMFIEQGRREKMISLLFAIIFMIISFISCFNTILNNTLNRKKEIVTLSVIGITRGEIIKSNIIEGVGYGFISAIIVALLQIIIILLDYYINQGLFFFKEIIYVFILLDISIIIVCSLFSFISIYFIFKRLDKYPKERLVY